MSNQLFIPGIGQSKKSKLQLRYEKLILDIEAKKLQNESLENAIRETLPKIHSEIFPLHHELEELHIKRLLRLEEVVDEIKISKRKKEIFIDYMQTELSNFAPTENEEFEALRQKYKLDISDLSEMENAFIANMIKNQTGLDIDIEEMKAKGMEDYLNEHAFDFENVEPKKKKSKKQQAKIDKENEEEKILALDAKAIYFRLIKKYHPDRQQDKAKQKEFTEITKLVTKAYKDNDFMGLLKLQIEYLDENELDASTLADDMLTRYNKILQGQLNELNWQLETTKIQNSDIFNDFLDKNFKLNDRKLQNEKINLKHTINNIKLDLEYSSQRKKAWFEEWLIEMENYLDDYDDVLFNF